jgi:MFS family permease
VGWFQLQIGVGAVAAFAVSAMIASSLQEIAEWKWCFGLGAIPPACLLLLLRWVPEEPHWLARHGRSSEAAASATRLGFTKEEWPVEQSNEDQRPPASPEEKLFQRRYLRPLLLAASVALFNQLCGVTVLRVYLLDLLSSTGMGRMLSHRYGVILALLNLAALLLGMMIVDKIGRRPLLIAGSAGMALCLFLLVWACAITPQRRSILSSSPPTTRSSPAHRERPRGSIFLRFFPFPCAAKARALARSFTGLRTPASSGSFP